MMTKNDMLRSREAEKLQMELVINNAEKVLVYEEIVLCLNQVVAEAATLEHNPGSVSNECIRAINSIIFVYESMQLKEFATLSEFIP